MFGLKSAFLVLWLAAGCGSGLTGPTRVGTADDGGDQASDQLPEGPIPAFVVTTEDRTLVVPTMPAPTVTSTALWMHQASPTADQIVRAKLIGRSHIDTAGYPRCTCPEVEGSCLVPESSPLIHVDHIDQASGELRPRDDQRTCACYRTEAVCDAPPPPTDGRVAADPVCSCMEAYDSESKTLRLVSVAAGHLFLFGSFNNLACSGTTLFDTSSDDVELAPGRIPEAPPEGATYLGCNPNVMPMDYFPVWPPPPLPCAEADETTCSNCQNQALEGRALLLRNGRYFLVGENQSRDGGARFMWSWPARPDTCLSPADPCGDPAPFPGLAEALAPDSFQDFWVASNGRFALLLSGSRLLVLGPDQEEPIREASFNTGMMGDIIGVRFHPDARALIVAMRAENARAEAAPEPPPPPAAPRTCLSDASCGEGLLCHGDVCAPACSSDGDCLENGVCGTFCGTEGRCRRASEGYCNDAHPCGGDDVCQEGRCAPPPPEEDEL